MSSRNEFQKWNLNLLNLPYIFAILVFIIFGGLLTSLYLPLSTPRMPLASEVFDINQKPVTTFYIQNRRPVSLDEIPPFLTKAFLAVEDHRFYHHHGINSGRIIKAFIYDLAHRSWEQGGSTITQQLAKNGYLDQERSFWRKIKELYYAVKLELHLTKDQIIELYLNQIYFGHGAYGLKIAAQTYFNKELSELNQAEMALLAGLPKGPALYSPYSHPEAGRRRLREVLRRMLDCNYISIIEFKQYSSQPLHLPGLSAKIPSAPYFLDLLQDEINRLFPKDPGLIYRAGLRIESTLDLKLQKMAEKSLINGLPKLLRDQQGLIQPQGALIAVDPETGAIRALIGGTDFQKSKFNRATQAHRQPGSAFKPILYTALLTHGYTLTNQIDSTPVTYQVGSKEYRPTDGGHENQTGMLSLRQALAASSNVVAVKLLSELGTKTVISLARTLGITSHLPPHLSLALGSGEVTPLELTGAYIPLANGGFKAPPTTIRRIIDHNGKILYQAPKEHPEIINPGVAFLVTQALTSVFDEEGTAANIGEVLRRPAAGKTGTTEKNRDAWFLGYTPELLTCVFIGCDHNERSLPGAANLIAAPIWADFMSRALSAKPLRDFIIPNDITEVEVCSETGARATAFCPKHREYFLDGTEPEQYCEKHRFINLEVCARSGLLPSSYCRDLETRQFLLGEEPTETCNLCRRRLFFFDWLRHMLRSR